jgi:hypothetical protein
MDDLLGKQRDYTLSFSVQFRKEETDEIWRKEREGDKKESGSVVVIPRSLPGELK